MTSAKIPDGMPVLLAGSHRSPRDGGCFMEIASLLAGERWSDHPRCTDPVLAEVARDVNDLSTDEGRQHLGPMIPTVIGTSSEDARVAPALVSVVARAALQTPQPPSRRRALEGAVERAQRLIDASADGDALQQRYRVAARISRWFYQREAKLQVAMALRALAPTRSTEADGRLRAVLEDCIGTCRRVLETSSRARPSVVSVV